MILIHDLVEIVEVGPRDGLQNELKKISVEEKTDLHESDNLGTLCFQWHIWYF